MACRFNTVGFSHPEEHYVLAAKERLPQVKALVSQGAYFWLHGPRQTGKTTAMRQWATTLTQRSKYAAIVVSVNSLEPSSGQTNILEEESFLHDLREAARTLPEDLQPPDWGYQVGGQRIRSALTNWAEACPRPLVLFFDDIDTLDGKALTCFLRQLWSGAQERPQRFPQSMAFVGLQDINCLPVGAQLNTPGSLFHQLRTSTLALQPFTLEEVANVYQKHTDASGQLFTLEAVDRAFELTQGQPWLVNAIGQHAISHTEEPIESIHIEAAATHLLQQQNHHYTIPLDHLTSRLFHPSTRSILEAIFVEKPISASVQDMQRLVALGLCQVEASGGLVIANPLYRELILQELSRTAIASLGYLDPTWRNPDGTVNLKQCWDAFCDLWRHQGDALIQTIAYTAIAPYLAVMAFFHHVVHPEGSLTQTHNLRQQYVQILLSVASLDIIIHVMVWTDEYPDPKDRGVMHLESILSQQPVPHAGLILVDQRSDRSPCHKRTRLESATTSNGLALTIIRG